MKKSTKWLLVTTGILLVVVIIMGIFKNTSVGVSQEKTAIPEIAGIEKIDTERTSCSLKTTYRSTQNKTDALAFGEENKNKVKNFYSNAGWEFQYEEKSAMDLILRYKKDNDQLLIDFGPLKDGVGVTFKNFWPPCD